MKKTYISPKAKGIELHFEGLVAVSGEGDPYNIDDLGNKPVGGGTENDFSNRRGIWGNTEW